MSSAPGQSSTQRSANNCSALPRAQLPRSSNRGSNRDADDNPDAGPIRSQIAFFGFPYSQMRYAPAEWCKSYCAKLLEDRQDDQQIGTGVEHHGAPQAVRLAHQPSPGD